VTLLPWARQAVPQGRSFERSRPRAMAGTGPFLLSAGATWATALDSDNGDAYSGDGGVEGCDSWSASSGTGRAISGPALTTHNVAVGGTHLNEGTGTWSTSDSSNYTSALSCIPGIACNESGSVTGGSGLWSTGGGTSSLYSKPLEQLFLPWRPRARASLGGWLDRPSSSRISTAFAVSLAYAAASPSPSCTSARHSSLKFRARPSGRPSGYPAEPGAARMPAAGLRSGHVGVTGVARAAQMPPSPMGLEEPAQI
jgi:hypothetical protein